MKTGQILRWYWELEFRVEELTKEIARARAAIASLEGDNRKQGQRRCPQCVRSN